MSVLSTLLTSSGVVKQFGEIRAVDGVNLSLKRGDVVGLVGGNGAGKTTMLRLLCGLYRPTEGEISFHSKSGENRPIHEIREKLGVVPESTGLYHRLTAWENIRYHARLHGIDDDVAWNRTLRFAKALSISGELHRHTRGFSRGMRQKTALLRALVHGPEILLLDEPTAGLDVTSARMVRELVRKLRDEGGTVIYSTHHLAEAQMVCDRIIIMHNGQIRCDGTPIELMAETSTENLEDAYVALTSDVARTDSKEEKEGKMARIWRTFLTPSRRNKEVEEDE